MKKRVKVLNEQTIISSTNSEKKKSPITTHVLDTALGKPAEGIKVTLNNRSSAAPWISKEGYTNADGRVTDLMGGVIRCLLEITSLFFTCKSTCE